MKPRLLVGAVLLAILVGAAAGWWLRSRQAETEMSLAELAHHLERIGLCVSILGMKEAELSEKTRRVLEHCLASSLSPANDLLSSGVEIARRPRRRPHPERGRARRLVARRGPQRRRCHRLSGLSRQPRARGDLDFRRLRAW